MILINVTVTLFIIGVVLLGISLVNKNKKLKIAGISILILLVIGFIAFVFYALYEEDQEMINRFGTEDENSSDYMNSLDNTNNIDDINTQNNGNVLDSTNTFDNVNSFNDANTTNNELPVEYSGIVQNIGNSSIECGPLKSFLTNLISLNEETKILNYLTNKEMKLEDIKQGDCIKIIGTKLEQNNDLEKIYAKEIYVYTKNEIKNEAGKYIVDTYRIDDSSISYFNVDSSGEGYIICEINVENFSYPIKLNVNKSTETFLGYSMHLQSNYGYIPHEMCWITMDTKVEDIDNIKGYVKMIEYIAD